MLHNIVSKDWTSCENLFCQVVVSLANLVVGEGFKIVLEQSSQLQ